MIRSIAFELFDRLTTDPDALRKQVAKARADKDAVETELLDYKCGTRAHAANATTEELARLAAERDALQLQVSELKLQHASSPTDVEHTKLAAKLAVAQLEIARLRGGLTIEPTWILALWSVHAEAWTESHRGSYDAMNEKMRANATQWNLFPRSAWDALVKNGRAR